MIGKIISEIKNLKVHIGMHLAKPTLVCECNVKLLDTDGKTVIKDYGWKPSKSLTRQFLHLIHSNLIRAQTTTNDIAGTPQTYPKQTTGDWDDQCFQAKGGEGDTNRGIVIGLDATAPDNDDHKLGNLISHGSASGEMSYAAMSIVAPAEVGVYIQVELVRVLTNSSGATITVSEVGIHVYHAYSNWLWTFLIARDIITPLNVLHLQAMQVTYRLRTQA